MRSSASSSAEPSSPKTEQKESQPELTKDLLIPENGQAYDCVVAAGRGLKDKEGILLILQLACALNAPVIATRGAVEDGLLPESHLVGMSGKRVRCAVYIAFGVSGSNFHTCGVRGIDRKSPYIIAVNPDPKARIHEIADIPLYADCKSVLKNLLRAAGDKRTVPQRRVPPGKGELSTFVSSLRKNLQDLGGK